MAEKKIPQLETSRIVANFNKVAPMYDQFAVLQSEIADRLLDRLEIVKLEPQVIIDAGARTGYTSRLLRKRYPQAQIFSVDWAEKLLNTAHQASSLIPSICAIPESLPFPSHSVDLIFANLTWHWLNDPIQVLLEWRRLLKLDGLLVFSTLGPDTFHELRASFAAVDEAPHVHLFLDMHDIGDTLLAAQFSGPVMQAEHFCLSYSSAQSLWKDLRETGVTNVLADRRRTLTGKNRWQRMLKEYEKWVTAENAWPATIEVIYGLGWVEDSLLAHGHENGEVTIPIDQIRRNFHG